MIWDTVMMHDELDMLELRLTELESVPNLVHVVVEADVTHQDKPKPSYLSDNWERFSPWHERIVRVWATGLPKAKPGASTLVMAGGDLTTVDPDPWAREHAQREHTWRALGDASPDDIVLHGDLDEIPTALVVRNTRPPGFVTYEQVGMFWSLRWRYPLPWRGTVAARLQRIKSFGDMRDMRNMAPFIPNAGWHLSWLPKNGMTSARSAYAKVNAYCHPEVSDRINEGTREDHFLRSGIHVDGQVMTRIDAPHTDRMYPKWVRDGNAPDSWFL